ncbi:MAG: hypothetical protein Unbinned5179contig1004_43 [Prokaryotic dsDNA virus sp.]|nr:MAG: hypothetical protein Unbinned5179contig1004_43 [Prokaryotic dsDNA virus sp.]|tara:strand:- start:2672 stop:2968 length:297 start_codon:yes stop_codon:yes gene_type:complete
MEKETLKISFDNAGGVTLETDRYCHHYTDARCAAEDAAFILDDMTTVTWCGNEPDHRLEDAETQHYLGDIQRIISAPFCEDNHSGYSETEFYKTLKGA